MQDFGLKSEVIEEIVKIISHYPEVEKAVIFGSRARGDYRKASDIDIALFGDTLTFTINSKIFYEIEDLYLVYKIDLINFNSLSDTDKLKQNILKEGVEIYAK